MILVDTSIWIDHLHRSEPALVQALRDSEVAQHPMVVGELALGSLRDREAFLDLLTELPQVRLATHAEVRVLVEERRLYGQGLSLVDSHLVASVLLTAETRLWTRDRRLRAVAEAMDICVA